MVFKEKLKQVCKQEGVNLREFSELAGIPYGTIRGYSQGRNAPLLAQIEKMTEHPRLAKYRNYLLSTDEKSSLDAELMALFRQLEEAGKGDQALEYLRYLAEREGR